MIKHYVPGESIADKLNEVIGVVNSVAQPGTSTPEQEWSPEDPNTNAERDH